MSVDKVRENRVRRWAARLDHRLMRSRAKRLHMHNRGLYMLADYNNRLALGPDYDASLDDVEEYLGRVEAKLKKTA